MKISDDDFFRKSTETLIRLTALGLLAFGCYLIFKPFLIPIVWGIIIAIGVYPFYKGIKKVVRGNRYIASSIIVLLLFGVLALPAFLLTKSFIEGATTIAKNLEEQSIKITPPSESVKDWPIIGPKVFYIWDNLSKDLTSILDRITPQLKPIGVWVLTNLTKVGLEIVFFIIAILFAGILLVFEEKGKDFSDKLAIRLSGDGGSDLIQLTGSTVRNVTQVIIGVALIQSILAGVALLLAGVPHAGLWSFFTLIFLIIQVPILVILGPVVIYLFSYGESHVAVLFLIWTILLGVFDGPLRAIFFRRGTMTPMPIIFIGAIGGLIQLGFIGLFIGAVVLALGYKFFLYWLNEGDVKEFQNK
ncbi:MAG: AI-2E family transporter [Bacteriovoracales bacterium]